jgi:NADH-quinone oxidoreductase subunit J
MQEIYILLLTFLLIFFCISTNTMYSVFSFIAYALLLFICFFFFKVEFLTYLFLIIYMGAIVVLFLFVIMLIEFKPLFIDNSEKAFLKILLIFFSFYSLLISIKNENINTNLFFFNKQKFILLNNSIDLTQYFDILDIAEIGLIIYDCYIVLFLNITLLFLMGIINVVLLTKTQIKLNFYSLSK